MGFTVRGVSDWHRAWLVCVVGVLLACGLQTANGQAKLETPQQTNLKIQQLASFNRARPAEIPIGSGDVLHVEVFDVPELSRDVRVSDTGDISYPLIPGKIAVANLTVGAVESKLEQLLIQNGLVSHPDVSVVVKEENSQPVSVVGAVNHTMIYQVTGATTLLEVLSAAGGISNDAGSVVIVTRPAPAGAGPSESASPAIPSGEDAQRISIRLQDLLESGDPAYNIPIYSGDTVTVPRAGIVYVLGFGVVQPGGYVLENHGEQITVLKAIALAHGLTSFAKPNSAVILRPNSATGQKDSIPVEIQKITKRQAEDLPLQSNDILYVPDSAGRKALAHMGAAALGVGTGVAIYRLP